MLKILVPKQSGIYRIAADEFAAFCKKITGKAPAIVTADDGKSDLAVLGSDAVNAFTHSKIIEKVIPQFEVRTNTDDYQIVSAEDGKRKLLFIAGGRPRALLYGVYHYFESEADCRYFWDGDIVPKQKALTLDEINILESPRFEYRGLRYFAHRSLNRFQAEHWDFEEWKQEIDWVLKKRMNVFMLRMGLDDLFQKAFPDVVSYPDGYKVPEASERSFDDRTLFWSLQYRGELRKKVLAYARERDLLHPEDVGTMSHWYSRTPYEFLKKFNPGFIPQITRGYNEETGLVWDIRKDENLDRYFKLTETHIAEYGSPDMFHTIGLAERCCYEDHESNHQMKLYTYRRIVSKLREKYPNAPLLIASWDFCMTWTPEEVQALIEELDPARTIILEYTSDTTDEVCNFTNWGLVNRFPWIFGIFHAYEPANDIRGNYEQLERRLPIAAEDPMCKGLVYWPECSHTDTLMLEYMAANSWNPAQYKVDEFLPGFCDKRYPGQVDAMLKIWRKIMPLVKLGGWEGPKDTRGDITAFSHMQFHILQDPVMEDFEPANLGRHQAVQQKYAPYVSAVPEAFRMIARMTDKMDDEFIRRDLIDLGKTVAARLMHYAMTKLRLSMEAWRNGKYDAKKLLSLLKSAGNVLALEAKVLDAHEDYSMLDALRLLNVKHETNPDFEYTLKGNAESHYCRSYISEMFKALYLPEWKVYANWVTGRVKADDRSQWDRPAEFDTKKEDIREAFYAAPLKKFAPDRAKAQRELAQTLEKLAAESEKIINRR